MKKLLSSVSVILVLVMLLSMAAPMTASAAGDGITEKNLTANIYSMEDTEKYNNKLEELEMMQTV